MSERFVYGTECKLAELMSRELRELCEVALLIDGVHFGEHVVLAAVGVDKHGDKHVLGLREGATAKSWRYCDRGPTCDREIRLRLFPRWNSLI